MKKQIVCLAVGIILTGGVVASAEEEGKLMKPEIGVNYEWGALKEVVVGIGDGLVMPAKPVIRQE